MTKLTTGVVGLGDTIFHLEAYASSPKVDRVVICDSDTRRTDALRRQFPKVGAVYQDLGAMLRDENLDVVSLAVEHDQNLDCGATILNAGANLILTQPFAKDLDAAEEIVRIADKRGVRLMVSQEARFRPRFVKIRQLIERGFFGEIIHIRMGGALHVDEPAPEVGDDRERNLTAGPIEEIDLLRFLVNEEIVDVTAVSNEPRPPNQSGEPICALFRFAGGCIGQTMIDNDYRKAKRTPIDDQFRLIGSKGMAVGRRAYSDGLSAWTPLPNDHDEARIGAIAAVSSLVNSLWSGVQLGAATEEALIPLRLRHAVDQAMASRHQIFVAR